MEWASKFSITRGSPSGFCIKGATPLLPPHRYAMWPLGSAVRVLDTALRSRRSAALLIRAHSALPPSLPPPQSQPAAQREQRASIRVSLTVTEAARHCSPHFSAGTSISLTAPRRSCDFTLVCFSCQELSAGSVRLLDTHAHARTDTLPGDQFIPWMLGELSGSCEQVNNKAEARDLPPRSVLRRRDSSQSWGR